MAVIVVPVPLEVRTVGLVLYLQVLTLVSFALILVHSVQDGVHDIYALHPVSQKFPHVVFNIFSGCPIDNGPFLF